MCRTAVMRPPGCPCGASMAPSGGRPPPGRAAISSPEHGWTGQVDANVPHGRDAATGLPVWSLYGSERRPSPAMLAGVDTFLFFIPDTGVRPLPPLTALVLIA